MTTQVKYHDLTLDEGKYKGIKSNWSEISKSDMMRFLKPDGTVLHTQATPQAWQTGQTYATRASKMYNQNISWDEAGKLRVTKGSGSSRYGRKPCKLEITGTSLTLSNDDSKAIITQAGVTMSWQAGADYKGQAYAHLTQRADDILKALATKDAEAFADVIKYYLSGKSLAKAGKYQVEVPAEATIHEAKGALYVMMSEAKDSDFSILEKAVIIKQGLPEYQDWFKKSIK